MKSEVALGSAWWLSGHLVRNIR